MFKADERMLVLSMLPIFDRRLSISLKPMNRDGCPLVCPRVLNDALHYALKRMNKDGCPWYADDF